jgi:hypothetical protein
MSLRKSNVRVPKQKSTVLFRAIATHLGNWSPLPLRKTRKHLSGGDEFALHAIMDGFMSGPFKQMAKCPFAMRHVLSHMRRGRIANIFQGGRKKIAISPFVSVLLTVR